MTEAMQYLRQTDRRTDGQTCGQPADNVHD